MKVQKRTELRLDEAIARVVISADGRRIAASGQNQGSLLAWEVAADGASARPIALDRKADGEVISLGFSPGGEALAVGDRTAGFGSGTLPRARPGRRSSRVEAGSGTWRSR